ncbi:splicing factor ESS-2 homolog isoform X4 [Delphinus delphis]|uniref:Splicing factor ESS-2 homolog isoform X3 n=1 Tax=Tursiops truncatus TaxID=9739 RepID=A0A6J3PU65_TURTR|nr:splicing factor ESS-2 homolog isoform X3 [Tursiops truncatus]XP_059885466.1 splicing factor ESS-2 homolog isoform X4 [Delphinus delphis]
METPGPAVRAVLVPAASGTRRKRAAGEAGAPTSRQRVLDEEEYIEGLQTVIQRDFFPDVEKLQAQKEYLEAEENGDLERMRQIAIKFGSALGKMSREPPPPYVTPATFETPEVHTGTGVVGSKAPGRGHSLEDGDEPSLLPVTARPACPQSVVLRCDVARESQTVGRFLSFESPLFFGEATEEEEREPLPSLDVFLSRYTSEDNASFQEIMEVAKEKSRARHAWLYQAEEEFEKSAKPWRVARLVWTPGSTRPRTPSCTTQRHKQGKVGPDGKELIPQESPRVGGFGFIATPSPAPGVNESPLMTWGEVENTPLRVEGSETPYVDRTPGPAFKILEPGRRERLGLKMANEAAAKNRAKKQEALRRATENLASLTPKGLSPAMSPALQRLVSRTASKYTDRALRASYTPSPARSTHLKTPAGGPQTPTSTPAPGSATHTPLSQDPACITDNLLQLPARRKASDFF